MKIHCQKHQREVEGVEMAILHGAQMQSFWQCPFCLRDEFDVLRTERDRAVKQRDVLSDLYTDAIMQLRIAKSQ